MQRYCFPVKFAKIAESVFSIISYEQGTVFTWTVMTVCLRMPADGVKCKRTQSNN